MLPVSGSVHNPAARRQHFWLGNLVSYKKGNQQKPFQAAVSIISIASVLVGLGCYVAAINELPHVSELLFNVAVQVYHWVPALNDLHAAEAPMLVAALTIGTVFFIFTIPLAYWLAGVFSRAGIKSIERQTARLKKLQIDRKTRKRNDDDFKVA